MEVICNNYMPGDSRLVEQLVSELKSQGIFDQFRKECISDVDTKPAYQNLRQRVEGTVSTFLNQQAWSIDLNKNQLREQLRKNLHESGFLETGVERIVDQVVNPKISTVFLPKVEDVVYRFLGIERPAGRNVIKKEEKKVSITDLLPTDLEAVSPESVDSFKIEKKNDDSLHSSSKMDEDESPPFEPLGIQNSHENSMSLDDTKMQIDENSRDSHLSGFSGLESHESNQGSDTKTYQMDLSNQDSLNSIETRLSIITSEETTKMENFEDAIAEIKNEKPEITSDEVDTANCAENAVSDVTGTLDVKKEDPVNDINEKIEEPEKKDRKHDKQDDRKSRISDKSKDRKDDKHKKSGSSKDKEKSSSKHSSHKDWKDKDANKKDSRSGSSSSHRDKERSKERSSDSKDRDKSSKYKKHEKDRTAEKTKSDKDTANREEKNKDKNKLDKNKQEKDKSSREKDKYKSDKDKHSKDKEKSKNKDKERSSKSKEKSDRDKDKNSKEKFSKDKDAKEKANDKDKAKTSSSNSSSSGSKHSSSKDKKEKSKNVADDSKSKSSSDKTKREDAKHSGGKRDPRDSKKKSKDDHYSSKIKKTDRRSTDRDSNDGTSSKNNCMNNYSESMSSRSENNSQDQSNSSFSGGSGDSGNSDQADAAAQNVVQVERSAGPMQQIQPVKYMKPKFASNFEEARKIMKIRKQLARMERQNQLSLTRIDVPPIENGVAAKDGANVILKDRLLNNIEVDHVHRMDLLANDSVKEKTDKITDNITCITSSNQKEIAIESADLSMENFEALEAKLAQVMSKINYNSYESDDDYEFHGYSSADLLDAVPQQTINVDCDENDIVLDDRVSIADADHSKQPNNHRSNNVRELSVVLNKPTGDIYKTNVCLFLEKPTAYEENNLKILLQTISKLQKEINEAVETSRNNFWPLNRGKKRNLDECVDFKNNNDIGYVTTVNKRRVSTSSNTVSSKAVKKRMCNNTDIPDEHFSLPLSPAESDKSNDRKEEDLLIPMKQKRIIRGYSQRYSSEDLYKPRPIISRRNKFPKNTN